MSEFSRSVHVRTGGDVDEASVVGAAEAARATALVLPQRGPWITVIVSEKARDELLACVGLAVDYDFAGDHGVTATLYERGERLGRLHRDFERGRTKKDAEAFVERGLLTKEELAELPRALQERRGHPIAEALELKDYMWVSSEDLFLDRRRELEARYPGGTFLDDGRREPWALPSKRARILLCALSARRLEQLRANPEIAADLLGARRKVPGLLDLGERSGALARDTLLSEAVLGRRGEPIAVRGATARILSAEQVSRVAKALPARREPALRAFYKRAAARDEAVLIVVD